MISWVNPDETMSKTTLSDYLKDGLVEAIEQVKKIAKVDEINCVGYCMGGTLLSIGTSYLSAKNIKGIKSITLLTTLTDFERCGNVKVFITDEMLDTIENHMQEKGFISGHDMFSTFSIIKSNDMIWYYFINKYLLGNEPKAIDVLYWNSDSTRIPYEMHKQCLRDLYQNNLLAKNNLVLDGVNIDLRNIKCPIYFFATQDDHIAPWESVYKGLKLYSGTNNKRFILSKSGHVAAVINHPDKNKYGYWFDPIETKKSKDIKKENPQDWLDKAQYKDGSWWNDWSNWMSVNNLNGESIKAEKIEIPIEDAPGSYVKVK
jgi:polyhydroxyalkanoate synthase